MSNFPVSQFDLEAYIIDDVRKPGVSKIVHWVACVRLLLKVKHCLALVLFLFSNEFPNCTCHPSVQSDVILSSTAREACSNVDVRANRGTHDESFDFFCSWWYLMQPGFNYSPALVMAAQSPDRNGTYSFPPAEYAGLTEALPCWPCSCFYPMLPVCRCFLYAAEICICCCASFKVDSEAKVVHFLSFEGPWCYLWSKGICNWGPWIGWLTWLSLELKGGQIPDSHLYCLAFLKTWHWFETAQDWDCQSMGLSTSK